MCLKQVSQGLFGIFGDTGRQIFLPKAAHSQNVEDEHTMISRYGTTALTDDVRVRNFGFITDTLDVIDHVARVLLECVVHARFEIGLRAVIIYPEPASDIEILEPGTQFFEVDIDSRALDNCALNLADVGNLAAEMKVE